MRFFQVGPERIRVFNKDEGLFYDINLPRYGYCILFVFKVLSTINCLFEADPAGACNNTACTLSAYKYKNLDTVTATHYTTEDDSGSLILFKQGQEGDWAVIASASFALGAKLVPEVV